MKSAADAFEKISAPGTAFLSRGHKSGAHTKELAIWKTAGIDPKGQKWYLEVGRGMEKPPAGPVKDFRLRVGAP